MNKYLVNIYIPLLEEKFDVMIASSKRVKDVIYYVSSIVSNLTDNEFKVKNYSLINRLTGNVYDSSLLIADTDIANGTELIII